MAKESGGMKANRLTIEITPPLSYRLSFRVTVGCHGPLYFPVSSYRARAGSMAVLKAIDAVRRWPFLVVPDSRSVKKDRLSDWGQAVISRQNGEMPEQGESPFVLTIYHWGKKLFYSDPLGPNDMSFDLAVSQVTGLFRLLRAASGVLFLSNSYLRLAPAQSHTLSA